MGELIGRLFLLGMRLRTDFHLAPHFFHLLWRRMRDLIAAVFPVSKAAAGRIFAFLVCSSVALIIGVQTGATGQRAESGYS